MKPMKIKALTSAIKGLFGGKRTKGFRQTSAGNNTITIGGFTHGAGTSGTAGTNTHNDLEYKPLPIIGHLPLKLQYGVGAGLLGTNILLAGLCMSFYYSGLTSVTTGINIATKAQTEIQRAAKNMAFAVKGQPVFAALKESKERLDEGFVHAKEVSNEFDENQSYKLKKLLAQTQKHWGENEKDITKTLESEAILTGTAYGLKKVDIIGSNITQRLGQTYDLMLQSGESDVILQQVYYGIALSERMSRTIYELSNASVISLEKIQLMQDDAATLKQIIQTLKAYADEHAKTDPIYGPIYNRLTVGMYEFEVMEAFTATVVVNAKETPGLFNGATFLGKQSDTIMSELSLIIDDYTVKLQQVTLRAYVSGLFGFLGLLAFLLMIGVNMKDAKKQALEDKREQLSTQNAIMRLLDEMGNLADGDLTVRATVTEEITGAIADSVNFAISQLGELVGHIQAAANQMDSATQKATEISFKLLKINEQQSKDISETGDAVLRIASSIEEVSRRMSDSQRVAEQSVDSANKGMIAVSSSIEGMKSIQTTVEETAKRIRRLTAQSKEIYEIVDLIADISERTSVLAINATVQATKAGAAGKGFKVVADAVQDLANQAADATRKIGALMNAIQTDIQGAGNAMDKTSQEATTGVQLAEEAGEVFAEISDVSMAMADIVSEINTEVSKSAIDAASASKTMKRVLESVGEAADSTKITSEAIADLAKLSERLRDSISGFKV